MDALSSNVIPPPPPLIKDRAIRSCLIQPQITLLSDNINSVKSPYPKQNANKVGDDGVPIQIDMAKSTAGMNSISKQES